MIELEKLINELINQRNSNNSLTGICSISKYPDSIISDLSRMNNHEFDNAFRYLEEIIQKQQRKQEAAAEYKQATDNAAADHTKHAVNKPVKQSKSCVKEEKKTNASSPICSSFDEQMRQLQEERKRLEEELELAKLRAENQKLKDQINRYNQSNKFFI